MEHGHDHEVVAGCLPPRVLVGSTTLQLGQQTDLSSVRILGLALLAIALLTLAACADRAQPPIQSVGPTAPPLPSLDPSEVGLGGEVYQASCASCHGVACEGQPDWKIPTEDGVYPVPPQDASGHTWHHGDGLLYQIIRDGGASLDLPDFKSNMPAFGNALSDAEIRAVLEYLKSTWPEQERQTQWLVSQNDPLSPAQ